MRLSELTDPKKLELPDIEVGDEVLVGKFKNRKATVKGFKTDDNNQPVLKTDKGDQKLFKPRIKKLMTEGLIVIPPKMLEHIDFLLTYNLLWKMRDRFKGVARQMPEQYSAFKNLVADFGEELPAEPYPKDQKIYVVNVPVDLRGMPGTYDHLEPRIKNIRFAIDWREGGTKHGAWLSDKDALIIYPFSIDFLSRFPEKRSHPEDLMIGLHTLREVMTHELRHMVQFVLLHDHPEQTKQKPGYEKHGKEYNLSPVEFDPTIGSAVREFLNLWNVYSDGNSRRMPLARAVRQFVGIEKTGAFDTFGAPNFFLHLRDNAPARYKVAIAKFFKELTAKLQA